MTIPVKENLTIFRGGVFQHRFAHLYPDDTPVDVTGYTARMHIREDWDSASPVLELTTENNRIIVAPLTGLFDVFIPATLTDDITIDAGVYDLEIIPPAGEDYTIKLAYGKIKVMPEATR